MEPKAKANGWSEDRPKTSKSTFRKYVSSSCTFLARAGALFQIQFSVRVLPLYSEVVTNKRPLRRRFSVIIVPILIVRTSARKVLLLIRKQCMTSSRLRFEFSVGIVNLLYPAIQPRAQTSLSGDRSKVRTPRRYLCEKSLERCL